MKTSFDRYYFDLGSSWPCYHVNTYYIIIDLQYLHSEKKVLDIRYLLGLHVARQMNACFSEHFLL